MDLCNNNFRSSTGLPAGVLDDVLDTLSLINPEDRLPCPLGSESCVSFGNGFYVDSIVRRAHFICSRADADVIVAATAGVDDCPRITCAQFNAALEPAGMAIQAGAAVGTATVTGITR